MNNFLIFAPASLRYKTQQIPYHEKTGLGPPTPWYGIQCKEVKRFIFEKSGDFFVPQPYLSCTLRFHRSPYSWLTRQS